MAPPSEVGDDQEFATDEHGDEFIEYRDLEPPKTGIFDGLRIVIDPDVAFEMQCFLLLHLFGHSVQWVAPSLEHKLADLQHTENRDHFMQVLHAYELEAAGFGMQLMHQVGVMTLDQWFSDFVETDWHYVERYYQTENFPTGSRASSVAAHW